MPVASPEIVDEFSNANILVQPTVSRVKNNKRLCHQYQYYQDQFLYLYDADMMCTHTEDNIILMVYFFKQIL